MAGATLFDRRGGAVTLSSAGVTLLAYAERVLQAVDSMNSYLEEADPWSGVLRIGSSELFAMTALPRVLSAFESSHPSLEVNLTIRASTFLMDALDQGHLDAAYVSDPDPTTDCELIELTRTDIAVLSNGEFNLPSVLTPDDLARQRVFMNPRPSAINSIVTQWLRDESKSTLINTCDSLPVTIQLVRQGLGIGVVPLCMVTTESDSQGVVIHATSPELDRLTIFLAHRRRLASQRVDFLVDTARAALKHVPGFNTVD
ncbi:hypothetical protein GCM10027344_16600 [Spelaeicoccus albus]